MRLVAAWVNRTLLRILRFNHLTRLRTSEPQCRVSGITSLNEPAANPKKPRWYERRRRCRLQRVLARALDCAHRIGLSPAVLLQHLLSNLV